MVQVIARVTRRSHYKLFAAIQLLLVVEQSATSFKMQWKALALALLMERVSAQGMLRFSCSQLTIDRVDPLVNPGAIPSPHLHQIVGGNSFNATMDPANHDLAADSTCTSCTFS